MKQHTVSPSELSDFAKKITNFTKKIINIDEVAVVPSRKCVRNISSADFWQKL